MADTTRIEHAPGDRVHVQTTIDHTGEGIDQQGTVTLDEYDAVRVRLDDGRHGRFFRSGVTPLGEPRALCGDVHWPPYPAPVCRCRLDAGHSGEHACGALDGDLEPMCGATWPQDDREGADR